MQQFPPRTPRFPIRLRENRSIAIIHLTHNHHPGPGAVLVTLLLHQIGGDMRVGDDEGGFAADPEREDGPVLVGPFLELQPGLAGGDVEFVADEGEGCWAWGEAQPEEDVVGDDYGWYYYEG